MRRTLIALGLCLFTLPLLASDHARDHHDRSISFDDSGPVTSCDQLRVSFDGERTNVVAEEIPAASSLRSLAIDASSRGGIRVVGSDDARFSVTACKAAAIPSDLAGVTVRLSGNALTADGPDSGDYIVYFLVRAPRNTSLDLKASNGPISVSGTGGTIVARSTNGPISLAEVDGSIDASASNGPISFQGSRGMVKLAAKNGPISVKLSGSSWQGGTFDAQTTNGPVSLKVPSSYASGIVVESDGHGPISCRADACRGTADAMSEREDRDQPRRLELGSGAKALHLSTSNGPISIRNSD